MADAALALMSAPASRYLMEGAAPARIGNGAFAASPGGNVFRTADGWLATAANTLAQFEALARALGRPELATAPDWLRLRPASPGAILRDCGTPRLEAALEDAFPRPPLGRVGSAAERGGRPRGGGAQPGGLPRRPLPPHARLLGPRARPEWARPAACTRCWAPPSE